MTMLSEAALVEMLRERSPGYIGDDAAVILGDWGSSYVVTKDLLAEDVHFRTHYFSPQDLAHKALHVNLSDIAAMGAHPKFILCGIGIPAQHGDYAREFLLSLSNACHEQKVTLIGGDTVSSTEKIFISITAIGVAQQKFLKYRNKAACEDVICVAGDLGHAQLGLVVCENAVTDHEKYRDKFLRPQARVREGIWLGEHQAVHSMMDISDGLFIDLKRLCEASGVAGVIDIEKLHCDSDFLSVCQRLNQDPQQITLVGGEDYGLLCIIDHFTYPELARDFFRTFGYNLQQLGEIAPGSGLSFIKNSLRVELNLKPFTHFGEE